MKKAFIHYYSGTGNTARAAHNLSEELKSLGYRTEVLFARKGAEAPAGQAGFHFFLSPVYAFSLPHSFRNYLRRLPYGGIPFGVKTKAAVIIVHGMFSMRKGGGGGGESRCLPEAVAVLRARGYDVTYADAVGYPENLTPVLPPPGATDTKEILIAADRRVREIAREVASGKKYLKRHSLPSLAFGTLVGFFFRAFGRRHVGKFYVSDADCTACGLCEKYCPSRAIRMKRGRPRWGWNCDSCLGCFNLCPEKAIQISLLRLFSSLILAAGLLLPAIWGQEVLLAKLSGFDALWIFGKTLTHPAARWAAGFVIYSISYLLLFWALDKIFYAMEGIPFLRPLIRWTFTEGKKRYVVPEFNPYKDR